MKRSFILGFIVKVRFFNELVFLLLIKKKTTMDK